MASTAEIPQQDEALKALIARFRDNPGPGEFTELAVALLARGHSSEALRISEHGIALAPTNVEGRVQRAAALLALGRSRVAYVELQRVLALDPNHRRAMRFLGKVFVEAGAPSRAAALLKSRSLTPESKNDQPPLDADPSQTEPKSKDDALPELLTTLTKDLGLSSNPPAAPLRSVEVTQVIRRKKIPGLPQRQGELATIDEPIVDTTQPGRVYEAILESPAPGFKEPAPLFGMGGLSAETLALGDEPLFQDPGPASVKPLDGFESEDLEPTHQGLAQDATIVSPPEGPAPSGDPPQKPQPSAAPPSGDLKTSPSPSEVVQFTPTTPLAPTKEVPAAFGTSEAISPGSEGLQVVDAPKNALHVFLAIATVIAILGYIAALLWISGDQLQPWLQERARPPIESPNPASSIP